MCYFYFHCIDFFLIKNCMNFIYYFTTVTIYIKHLKQFGGRWGSNLPHTIIFLMGALRKKSLVFHTLSLFLWGHWVWGRNPHNIIFLMGALRKKSLVFQKYHFSYGGTEEEITCLPHTIIFLMGALRKKSLVFHTISFFLRGHWGRNHLSSTQYHFSYGGTEEEITCLPHNIISS